MAQLNKTASQINTILNGGTDETRNVIICDGDSRTVGYTGGIAAPYSALLTVTANDVVYNVAVGGATMTYNEGEGIHWITQMAHTNVTNKKSRMATNNIVVIWGGWNDMNVHNKGYAEVYNSIVSYCNARKREGFNVVVVTEPNSQVAAGEENRLLLNTLLRNTYAYFADELADIGANQFLGVTGAADNTTYFVDGVHMTAAGYGIVADIVDLAIAKINAKTTLKFNNISIDKVGVGTETPDDKIHIIDGRIRFTETGQRIRTIGIKQGTSDWMIKDETFDFVPFRVTGDGKMAVGMSEADAVTSKMQVVGLMEYADNATALSNGLTVGAFYRTGDVLKVVHA